MTCRWENRTKKEDEGIHTLTITPGRESDLYFQRILFPQRPKVEGGGGGEEGKAQPL